MVQGASPNDTFLLMRFIVDREDGEDDNLSDRWWRRRKRSDQWFNEFLGRTSRTEKDLVEMIDRVFRKSAEKEKKRKRCSGQFGNPLIPNQSGSCINEESEPLIDVFDGEDNVVVVAEMFGVDKDSIDLYATENRLMILVDSPERKYCKEIKLPAGVDVKSSTSKLKNGVLEVRLKKLSEKLLIGQ